MSLKHDSLPSTLPPSVMKGDEEVATDGVSSASSSGDANSSSEEDLGRPTRSDSPRRRPSLLHQFNLRHVTSATINMRHYRTYEIWALGAVAVSVAFTVAESVHGVEVAVKSNEWLMTTFRTVHAILGIYFVFDYVWRFWCDGCEYACSFFGFVDLLGAAAILPDILGLVWRIPIFDRNCGSLLRAIRLLRVFRVLKLSRFVDELHRIQEAITAETHAVLVFFLSVSIALLFLGSALYVVEGGQTPTKGFESIPSSLWWAIVTLTTVGYGDTVPATFAGRLIACMVMLLGYSILAVPTITSVLGQTPSSQGARIGLTGLTTPQASQVPPSSFLRSTSPGGPMPLLAESEADFLQLPTISAGTILSPGLRDSLKDYPFTVHLPTRQGDADEYGYLQSSTFPSFIEAAVSTLLLPSTLPSSSQLDLGAASRPRPRPYAAKSACSVILPVALPETLEAGVLVEEIGPSTCTFAVGLFLRSSGRLCALGRLHHVWVDAASRRPAQMPPEARAACSRAATALRFPSLTESNL